MDYLWLTAQSHLACPQVKLANVSNGQMNKNEMWKIENWKNAPSHHILLLFEKNSI